MPQKMRKNPKKASKDTYKASPIRTGTDRHMLA